jgi:hypothetical protein
MSVASYVLGIVSALFVLVAVFELLRHRRLRERHAVWWIIAGILALIVGVFPQIVDAVAAALGVALPSNLVFFVSIAVLFLVSLQHSSELTNLEDRVRTLAERIAMIEMRRDAQHGQQHEPGGSTPPADDTGRPLHPER